MTQTPSFEGLDDLELSNPEIDEAAAAASLAKQQSDYQLSLPLAMQEAQAQEEAEQQRENALAAERQEYLDDPEREAERQRAREGGFMEDIAVGVRDFIDNTFQGDQRTREQIASDRADVREEGTRRFQERQSEINQSEDILAEGVRAVLGGRLDAINQTLNTGELIGDTAKTWLGIASEEDDIYGDEYERANWNFTVSENRTAIGKLVRGGFKLHTAMFGLKKIPGLGASGPAGRTFAARAQRLAAAQPRSMLADLIVTDSEDGTLVQQAAELFGIEHDSPVLGPLVAAMSVDEGSNPWEAKLLAMAEGGVLGLGVDALGEVLGAIRTMRRADKAFKKRNTSLTARKAHAEEVLDRHVKEVQTELESMKRAIRESEEIPDGIYHGTYSKGKIEVGGFRVSSGGSHPLGDGVYFSPSSDLAKKYGPEVLVGRAGDIKLKTLSLEELKKYVDIDAFEQPGDALSKVFAKDFDGVRVKGLYDSDNSLEEIVIFDPKVADRITSPREVDTSIDPVQTELDLTATGPRQLTLVDAGLDMTPAQTRILRETQDVVYGGSPDRAPRFEVDEKAARITSNTVEDVAVSQKAVEGFEGATNGRSTKSLFTDAAVKKMTAVASSVEEADGLRRTLSALNSRIDVDEISRRLGQSNEETIAKSFNVIRRFLGAEELSAEEALKTFDDMKGSIGDETFLSREGIFAARTIITDLSMQLNDLAGNSLDLVASGRELPLAQANGIIDRLHGLSRMYKESSVHYASGLQSFQAGPIKIDRAKLGRELGEIDKTFENMRGKLEEGDPQSIKDFQDLAQGLAMADGDPLKQMTVQMLFRELGGKAMIKVMYNSMLSGPITHARNAIGNLSTMVLRPTAMAIGQAMSGDINAAKASISSLSAVVDSFSEALSAGGKAWSTGTPAGGAKFEVHESEVARGLELLKQGATTDSEKRAANFLDMLHTNAVLNAPTRALAAGDDFFKILNARIELKRQTMMETLSETGTLKFDPDKYAKIAQDKIVNGEVKDDGLLRIAKEQTFQQDLEGVAKQVSDLLDSNPLTKYAVPFVRTPHNLMVYAGTYTPGINRFLKEAQDIRSGTDEAAKAMLKGRVAIGYGVLATGFGFAAAGNLTGNGPADPELRKIWLQSNQPQSIKIGDKWVSYASIEPLNVMFAAAADLQHAAPYLKAGEYDRLVSQLQYTFAKAVFERSYMKGLQTAIGYLNPQTVGNVNFAREGLNALNTFIPFSGLRRQMAKALAPDVYEFNNELQASLTRSWPGGNYLSGAESAVDIFTGQRKIDTKDPGILFHFANQFLPFNISQDNSDYVIDKLGELQIDTRTDFGDTYKGLELSAEDRAGINRLVAKGNLHGRLEKLMRSRDFQRQLEEWKKTVDKGITAPRSEQLWYKSITRMISQSRLRAASQYASLPREETDDFGGRLQAARYRKQLQGKGRYDELINFGN
jgi:hypothetical protein